MQINDILNVKRSKTCFYIEFICFLVTDFACFFDGVLPGSKEWITTLFIDTLYIR